MSWWSRLRRRHNPAPVVSVEPLWKRNHQDVWWAGASIHADNTPYGTPLWARRVWDDIVRLDPEAPKEYRPFYSMKTGGEKPLQDSFYDEIRERTAAGYLVSYTLKDGSAQDLVADVHEMARRGCLPEGVGLWNELDFGGRLTPLQFRDRILEARLPEALFELHQEYGVMVSPPGIASFRNMVLGGYGDVIADLFGTLPGVFLKVHSYGHLQPKYWLELGLKRRVQEVAGQPGCTVLVEECANNFTPEKQSYQNPGVADEGGAAYHGVAIRAAALTGMASCHFMLYHKWHHFNDISDSQHGRLRREVATELFRHFRTTGAVGTLDDLQLQHPRGKELDLASLLR